MTEGNRLTPSDGASSSKRYIEPGSGSICDQCRNQAVSPLSQLQLVSAECRIRNSVTIYVENRREHCNGFKNNF